MKQSDIFTLVLIAGIGTLAAFFACNAILGDPDEAKVEYKTVSEVIKSDLKTPRSDVFNELAINPTIEVYVGNCEDIDQNGILDMAELMACGRENAPEYSEEQLRELLENDECMISSEGVELCGDEKKEYIEGLLGIGDENTENIDGE